MRETRYAREIVTVQDQHGQTIERLFNKQRQEDEIRFSWWKNGRFAPRPLDLPERELLPLMSDAIDKGVFTEEFLRALKAKLDSYLA